MRNENFRDELKTAQFHLRTTPAVMERIRKRAKSNNISVQEYFERLIFSDFDSAPTMMDRIQNQYFDLKKLGNMLYLNTELLGIVLYKFVFIYLGRLEDFSSPEQKQKAFEKGIDRFEQFMDEVVNKTEKNDTLLEWLFGDKVKKNPDYLKRFFPDI